MQKQIKFKSYDGTVLNGIVEYPENQPIIGGVLLLHGCISEKNEEGFYSDRPSASSKYKQKGGMAEYLSDSGFLSLRFDYREQGENEKTHNMSTLSISGMINDTESGYQELKKHISDNIPVAIIGTSFAGGVAVKWINAYNRKIDWLFLMAPLLDFPYTIRKTGITMTDYRGMEILKDDAIIQLNENGYLVSGGKKMNRSFINEVMIMNINEEFKKLSCKILICHGNKDVVVPFETSVKFCQLNSMCELIPIENAVHGFGIEGDSEWETEQTKQNHETIYRIVINKLKNNDN